MNRKIQVIHEVFFSPAGSTEAVAECIADVLAELLHAEKKIHNYTLPENRKEKMLFEQGSLVVWASPVYAGRLPNKLLDYVKTSFQGENIPALPVVVYGNRNYDQALSELTGILREGGMRPFAAAAVPARHVFSEVLAAGRPDAEDREELKAFAREAAEKIERTDCVEKLRQVNVPGMYPPDRYYTPLKEDGTPAKFLKALPVIDQERCTGCGTCLSVCPMGSVKAGEKAFPEICGICIKCQACILKCPAGALSLKDEAFQSHRRMLEKSFPERKKAAFLL